MEWLNTQKSLMNKKYDTTTKAIRNAGFGDKFKVNEY